MMPKKPEQIGKATAIMEESVQHAVEKLRYQLCREAVAHATEALHQWVARGVEWFRANCGWIFLLEPGRAGLRAIPEATVGSKKRDPRIPWEEWRHSFTWHVVRAEKGDFSNNVRAEPRGYYLLRKKTKSELAVPLYDERGHEDGDVIGVYNLEADYPNAFFPALVQELQKNVTMLIPHLLVMRKWYHQQQHDESWIWHPEVHSWSPAKLAERFCHAVVQGASRQRALPPTCTIWNADPGSRRCWVLGTCGYDNDFVSQLALNMDDSVTGTVAHFPLGKSRRGTPKEVGFRNTDKAHRMGVTQIHSGSLRNEAKNVWGALNMYALHRSTILPTDRAMRRLCEQASHLLADVSEMRRTLGIAFVNGQLARAADPTPHPGIFRRALMKVLPCDAASLFVPQTSGSETRLVAIASTGFLRSDGSEVDPRTERVGFSVIGNGQQEKSITACCFTRPVPVLRNFPSEFRSNTDGVPAPSRDHPEVMMYGDADPFHRRRLGIGVKKPKNLWAQRRGAPGTEPPADAPKNGNVGVIRLYRSSAGRPFTRDDADFLLALASADKCGRLFENWAIQRAPSGPVRTQLDPDIPIPPSASIRAALRALVGDLGRSVRCGYFFVLRGAEYQEFACHPLHELPPDKESFDPESDDKQEKGVAELTVNGKPTFRAWVRLLAWSGAHLMRTILAFDCDDRPSARALLRDPHNANEVPTGVQKALMHIASRLTTNVFYPECDPQTSPKILDEFCKYVTEAIVAPDEENDPLLPRIHAPGPVQVPPRKDQKLFAGAKYEPVRSASEPGHSAWCPDPDLHAYGVTVVPGGSECRIPLRTGTKHTGVLTCRLESDFAKRVGDALAAAEVYRGIGRPQADGARVHHEATWADLRRGVGDIVGAWTRIVAPILEEQPL
jgi:hypothetical protein